MQLRLPVWLMVQILLPSMMLQKMNTSKENSGEFRKKPANDRSRSLSSEHCLERLFVFQWKQWLDWTLWRTRRRHMGVARWHHVWESLKLYIDTAIHSQPWILLVSENCSCFSKLSEVQTRSAKWRSQWELCAHGCRWQLEWCQLRWQRHQVEVCLWGGGK